MTEPPRRKRFQIHLSTAIVMMFVAGALIWANVRPISYYTTNARGANGRYQSLEDLHSTLDRYFEPLDRQDQKSNTNLVHTFAEMNLRFEKDHLKIYLYQDIEYGWPSVARSSKQTVQRYSYGGYSPSTVQQTIWRGLAVNALAALIILAAVWFFCEWLIRRRTARKGA